MSSTSNNNVAACSNCKKKEVARSGFIRQNFLRGFLMNFWFFLLLLLILRLFERKWFVALSKVIAVIVVIRWKIWKKMKTRIRFQKLWIKDSLLTYQKHTNIFGLQYKSVWRTNYCFYFCYYFCKEKCYLSLKLVYVVTYILFVRPIIPIFMCGTNGKDTLPSSSSRIE